MSIAHRPSGPSRSPVRSVPERPALRRCALALSVLSVFACADGLPREDEPSPNAAASPAAQVEPETGPLRTGLLAQGGTRLDAIYHASPGVERFVTFHDTALDVDCDWARVPGEPDFLHCVPSRVVDVLYADAACAQPVTQSGVPQMTGADPDPEAGAWVSAVEGPRDACDTSPQRARTGYQLGELAARSATIAYSFYNGRCTTVRNYGRPLRHLLVQPRGAFVRGRPMNLEVNGGLIAHRVRGEDLSELTGWVTTRDATPCKLQPDGRCIAGQTTSLHASTYTSPSDTRVYVDARCEVAAFTESGLGRCGVMQYGIDLVAERARVYPLTPVYSVFVRDESAPGGCRPSTVNAGFYAPGVELTASFPTGRPLRRGDGPLFVDQVVAHTARVIPLERGAAFEDAEGHPCTAVPAADGSLRCFPDRMRITDGFLYGDAQCTERLFANGSREVADTDLIVTERQPTVGKPSVIEALYTVKVHEGPVYQRSAGNCAAVTPTRPLLTRDRALPITVLPELKVVKR